MVLYEIYIWAQYIDLVDYIYLYIDTKPHIYTYVTILIFKRGHEFERAVEGRRGGRNNVNMVHMYNILKKVKL